MRRSPRPLLGVVVAVLALGAIGCGSGQVAADEIPGEPVALTVPQDAATPEAAGSDDSDSSSDSSSSDGSDSDDATADDTTGGDTSGSAAPAPEPTQAPAPDQTAPDAQAPAPADEPAPEGSDTQRFEEFCDQNAGAC